MNRDEIFQTHLQDTEWNVTKLCFLSCRIVQKIENRYKLAFPGTIKLSIHDFIIFTYALL